MDGLGVFMAEQRRHGTLDQQIVCDGWMDRWEQHFPPHTSFIFPCSVPRPPSWVLLGCLQLAFPAAMTPPFSPPSRGVIPLSHIS